MVLQLPSLVPPWASQSACDKQTPVSPLAVAHAAPETGKILVNGGSVAIGVRPLTRPPSVVAVGVLLTSSPAALDEDCRDSAATGWHQRVYSGHSSC